MDRDPKPHTIAFRLGEDEAGRLDAMAAAMGKSLSRSKMARAILLEQLGSSTPAAVTERRVAVARVQKALDRVREMLA